MQIVAHRGASVDAPENTLPAIELAWQQGADAVEIDVRASRDGKVVVIHDPTTARTAGRAEAVASQSLAELRQLDAGTWKNSQFAGTHIPTLGEALECVPSGKNLLIELKCGTPLLADLQSTLSAHDPAGARAILIAFSLPLLRRVRQALPQIPAYWVWDVRRTATSDRIKLSQRLLHLVRRSGVQGLNLSACPLIDKPFARRLQSTGCHVGTWTVDDAETARNMLAAGADSLTTNRPGWIREQIQQSK
jgi:glycerophosphoryl diester phosphodiesterase